MCTVFCVVSKCTVLCVLKKPRVLCVVCSVYYSGGRLPPGPSGKEFLAGESQFSNRFLGPSTVRPRFLGPPEISWNFLGSPGISWKLLESLRISQNLLGSPGIFWNQLEGSHQFHPLSCHVLVSYLHYAWIIHLYFPLLLLAFSSLPFRNVIFDDMLVSNMLLKYSIT